MNDLAIAICTQAQRPPQLRRRKAAGSSTNHKGPWRGWTNPLQRHCLVLSKSAPPLLWCPLNMWHDKSLPIGAAFPTTLMSRTFMVTWQLLPGQTCACVHLLHVQLLAGICSNKSMLYQHLLNLCVCFLWVCLSFSCLYHVVTGGYASWLCNNGVIKHFAMFESSDSSRQKGSLANEIQNGWRGFARFLPGPSFDTVWMLWQAYLSALCMFRALVVGLLGGLSWCSGVNRQGSADLKETWNTVQQSRLYEPSLIEKTLRTLSSCERQKKGLD